MVQDVYFTLPIIAERLARNSFQPKADPSMLGSQLADVAPYEMPRSPVPKTMDELTNTKPIGRSILLTTCTIELHIDNSVIITVVPR